jgi:hypothetical protein
MNHTNVRNLSGLSTGYFDSLDVAGNITQYGGTFKSTHDISGLSIVGIPASYIMGLRSNIQHQFDSLQHVSISASYTTNYIIQDPTISGAIYTLQNNYIDQQNDILTLSGRVASNYSFLQNEIISLSGTINNNYNIQQNEILSLSGLICTNYISQQNDIFSLSGLICNNYISQHNEILSLSGIIYNNYVSQQNDKFSTISNYNIQQDEILSLSGIMFNYQAKALNYDTVSGMIEYRFIFVQNIVITLLNVINSLSLEVKFLEEQVNSLATISSTIYNIDNIINNTTGGTDGTDGTGGSSTLDVASIATAVASVGVAAAALALAITAANRAAAAQTSATQGINAADNAFGLATQTAARIPYITLPAATTNYVGQVCTQSFWVAQQNVIFANRADRLGALVREGLTTPIGPVHTLDTNGLYTNTGGILLTPLTPNNALYGNPPFKVDTMGNLSATGIFSTGIPNSYSQYPFNVDTNGSMKVGTPTMTNNTTWYPFNVGADGTTKIGTPTLTNNVLAYPFFITPNGQLIVKAILGNLSHQIYNFTQSATLCQSQVSTGNPNQSGYYFKASSGELNIDFITSQTNTNVGVVDAQIVAGTNNSATPYDGVMSLKARTLYHSGLNQFMVYRRDPTNDTYNTYILADNANTNDDKNFVSLNFKASKLNQSICDAQIVVTQGDYAIGALNTGSMSLNVGSQLILGPQCPDIQVGASVNYLYATGTNAANKIILGNQFTSVEVSGQLILTSAVSDANIVLQNVNGHLRQFESFNFN